MIDEEKQSTFAGPLPHHDVSLKMRKGILEIEVVDKGAFDQLHAAINYDFIERQDRYFKGHFSSPEEIFSHLAQTFKEIV